MNATAKFTQNGRDMKWSFDGGEDGTIRWHGYDVANWWDNVSIYEHSRTRVGPVTGRTYTIDFNSNQVTVSADDGASQVRGNAQSAPNGGAA